MNYKEEFKEENHSIMERYDLSMDRIETIRGEQAVACPYLDYFHKVADFIIQIREAADYLMSEGSKDAQIEEWKHLNYSLYEDILKDNYDSSYGNPSVAVNRLGDVYGQMLSFLYTEIRGDIVFAHENRFTEITVLNETFIEIYNLFEEGLPTISAIKDILYWFVSDYCDQTLTYRVRESLDSKLSFAADIIMDSDLSDLKYLYRFGEYISDSELQIADFLNHLPEETIDLMAHTYTEGYRKGFETMGRDITKKKTVMIRYELGFERMIKKAICNFRTMGLEPILCRAPVQSINRNPNRKVGYHSSSPNRQFDYDHRYDSAVYMDKALKDRKLALLKVSYEQYKKEAGEYGGPAVVETFGEESFQPINKKEAYLLSEKQQKLTLTYQNESTQIANGYVPGEETSFTIIAFPVPAIGADFPAIFGETIEINTLDYDRYRKIQQYMIDSLDEAKWVLVTGKGSNRTHMKVALHPLKDPKKETNFENCVADVNIPLGEVFTSPLLEDTEGLLHVGSVYIGDIQFHNLTIRFQRGKITEYSCENFKEESENQALVKQIILKNHETLPLGEFAIGTNTTAYAMAQKFGIIQKLPILIAEKMGPHFAVGDTCYSWSEDSPIYNPDGKEIIARDNEISLLRKEEIAKAYFGCHTDITIPYGELDRIEAVRADGSKIVIIADGKFVLPGTEELNKPLT